MSVGRKVLDKQMVKRKQIFDVQTWDRGFAGAVMCETRGPGIQWPQWHTLLFEGAGGGGDESGLLAGREEDASGANQDGLLEERGSKARV